jgi:hypothetical protein
MKAKKAPKIKAICNRYGVKATLAVRTHSTLVLNVKSGPIDFIGNFNRVAGKLLDHRSYPFTPVERDISVNPYWFHEHFDGEAKKFLTEVLACMNEGNHDRSDIQTDYFDVGWYVDVNIGKWNKPYSLITK